jgi:hypothetical protein
MTRDRLVVKDRRSNSIVKRRKQPWEGVKSEPLCSAHPTVSSAGSKPKNLRGIQNLRLPEEISPNLPLCRKCS